MRPSEFTEEQVIEAGNKLEDEGRRVTGFAIRKQIGGGNASRLKNIWDTYKQSQEVVEAEPVQELPVEVQDSLETLTGEFVTQFKHLVITLNNKAVATAERRVSEVIKAAKSEQDKAEAELSDAEIAVEELEAQVDQVNIELQENKKMLDDSEADRGDQTKEIAELKKQLAVMQEKADSLVEQLNQEKEETETRQNEINRLLSQVEDLKVDKKAEAKNTEQWKKKAESYEKKASDLRGEKEELTQKLSDVAHELDTEKTASKAKDKKITDAKKAADKALTANEKLKTETAALSARVDDRNIQIASLKDDIKDSRAENKNLQAELVKIAKKTKGSNS